MQKLHTKPTTSTTVKTSAPTGLKLKEKSNTKCVVFGGAGFIGSPVVDLLIKNNINVRVIDRNKKNNYEVENLTIDVIEEFDQIKFESDTDFVINLISFPEIDSEIDLLSVFHLNFILNIKILEKLKDNCPKAKYIFASTLYASSNFGGYYKVSKLASEEFIKEFCNQNSILYQILRYGTVYGFQNRSNIIYQFLRDSLTKGEIVFDGSGDEEREFIYYIDCAEKTVEVILNEEYNNIYLITGVERFKYKEVVKFIEEIIGSEVYCKFLHSGYKKHYLTSPYQIDKPRARKLALSRFTDFKEGLREMIEEMIEK